MQPNKREKEILCKYNYALLLTETNYEPPSADYPSLIKDYDHEIVSKIPNVSLFVGNRELKFTELQIESKLILIETEILGNCCGLPLYFKLIDKRCFVFGMCCGVKDSSNRQIAVFINQNVINNIMEMKHKWSQIQIISIKTESLHKITSPNSGTLIPINDK